MIPISREQAYLDDHPVVVIRLPLARPTSGGDHQRQWSQDDDIRLMKAIGEDDWSKINCKCPPCLCYCRSAVTAAA